MFSDCCTGYRALGGLPPPGAATNRCTHWGTEIGKRQRSDSYSGLLGGYRPPARPSPSVNRVCDEKVSGIPGSRRYTSQKGPIPTRGSPQRRGRAERVPLEHPGVIPYPVVSGRSLKETGPRPVYERAPYPPVLPARFITARGDTMLGKSEAHSDCDTK
jgi:hypothetical protein